MSSVTAVQLVNRVRLFRRQPPVTAIVTDEDNATVNALNMAIEDILGTRRWPFDLRHDGQLVTRAPLEITSVQFPTKGATDATLTHSATMTTADLGGDYVSRVVPTGDDEYSSTAFRIDTYSGTPSMTANVDIAAGAPVAETITGAKLIYSEYMFPDTVRELVRISHQQDDMRLEMLSDGSEFDEWIPNSAIESGAPQVFAVGGFDEATHEESASEPARLRGIIWPVPDNEYVLNYSYYYRHPELSVTQGSLDGVPAEVVSDIVYQATSTMGMVWDSNYAMAHLGDMAQSQATAKNRALGSGGSGRHTVNAWDSGGGRMRVEQGFPGKLIG